ncbi:MAG: LysM peptidoglycan-binding domain-containing protein, partial [Planctomycetes bacterium]|nr:LysM peptidoglycan-binding domain-containing protein [Planctomycetota bacterium]
FREPGNRTEKPANIPVAADGGAVAAPSSSGMTRYTVKSGDSLWAIAARTYGRGMADKMVPEIKRANPGTTDKLKPNQVLVLPPK